MLFLEVPTETELKAAADGQDAIGIAGITRSMRPEQILPIVSETFQLLASLSPRVVQYKICSTADSGTRSGSIGPAVEVGRALFGNEPVPILTAQPGLGRYTVFGNHFARGTEGMVERLDRHPMASHPVTPMSEADLSRHFSAQIGSAVGLLDLVTLRAGGGANALNRLRREDVKAYVIDGLEDTDLEIAARMILSDSPRTTFAIGSGGLSIGLARARPTGGFEKAKQVATPELCLAVSGSASVQTTRQIDRAIERGWHTIYLSPASLEAGADRALTISRVKDEAAEMLNAAPGVVVYTSHRGTPLHSQLQDPSAIGAALAEVITHCRQELNVERVVVAGGDTSGFVLRNLRARTLTAQGTVGSDLLLGSITSYDKSLDGLEVVLKGGQLGSLDVFEEARTYSSLDREGSTLDRAVIDDE